MLPLGGWALVEEARNLAYTILLLWRRGGLWEL